MIALQSAHLVPPGPSRSKRDINHAFCGRSAIDVVADKYQHRLGGRLRGCLVGMDFAEQRLQEISTTMNVADGVDQPTAGGRLRRRAFRLLAREHLSAPYRGTPRASAPGVAAALMQEQHGLCSGLACPVSGPGLADLSL